MPRAAANCQTHSYLLAPPIRVLPAGFRANMARGAPMRLLPLPLPQHPVRKAATDSLDVKLDVTACACPHYCRLSGRTGHLTPPHQACACLQRPSWNSVCTDAVHSYACAVTPHHRVTCRFPSPLFFPILRACPHLPGGGKTFSEWKWWVQLHLPTHSAATMLWRAGYW